MRVIDRPKPVTIVEYENAISRMVDQLVSMPGVTSVYQVGGVSNPGISDIDLVVVFEDGQRISGDPCKGLSDPDSYLFTHGLFGINRENFTEALKFSFFHNYRLLTGEQVHDRVSCLDSASENVLKRQVAMEYLIRMYINMAVAKTFRIMKLRSLLLNVKALQYDLDFLGIGSGTLFELVQQVIDWRNEWFERPVSARAIVAWFVDCYRSLEELLCQLLKESPLWLPERRSYQLARNIQVSPGDQLHWRHGGFVPPGLPRLTGRYVIKLLHRVNRFQFRIPMCNVDVPAPLVSAFAYQRQIRAYNAEMLPQFMTLTSSLNLS